MAGYNKWGDIYKHLKSNGFSVFSPGQHEGECVSRYVVVKISDAPQVSGFSSVSQQYDLLLYIPKDEYSELEDFIASVKQCMKGLRPVIMPVVYQTPSFYDEDVKGHMVNIRYRNSRKL